MVTKLNKPDALTVDMHVYGMTRRERATLEAWARAESRSANGQLLYIFRQALATHELQMSPSVAPSKAERITDATRAGLKGAKSVA